MCPQNYHRELLTLCKYGGNQTLTEYRRHAKEIRVGAEAETGPWILAEMQRQAQTLEKAAFQSMLGSLLDDQFNQLKRKARGGQLSCGELKMLKLFASRGYRDAQEILDRSNSSERSRKIICR
jgi:hypothetical protein